MDNFVDKMLDRQKRRLANIVYGCYEARGRFSSRYALDKESNRMSQHFRSYLAHLMLLGCSIAFTYTLVQLGFRGRAYIYETNKLVLGCELFLCSIMGFLALERLVELSRRKK